MFFWVNLILLGIFGKFVQVINLLLENIQKGLLKILNGEQNNLNNIY